MYEITQAVTAITKDLDGKFYFKKLQDGSIDKTKAVCTDCQAKFSYHQQWCSLFFCREYTVISPSPPHTHLSQSDTPYTKHCDVSIYKLYTDVSGMDWE